MTPEWGRRGGELPPETQFLLLELGTRGPYAVLLPLIDNSVFRATLRRRAAPAQIQCIWIPRGCKDTQPGWWFLRTGGGHAHAVARCRCR